MEEEKSRSASCAVPQLLSLLIDPFHLNRPVVPLYCPADAPISLTTQLITTTNGDMDVDWERKPRPQLDTDLTPECIRVPGLGSEYPYSLESSTQVVWTAVVATCKALGFPA